MSWLGTIAKHVDYLSGRYEALPVRDDTLRAAVMQVLDEVRRKELKRVHGSSALESAAFVDAEVPYQLYALKDTRHDQVIGCVRVTRADHIATLAQSREEYHLDEFPPELLARSQVFTRLAILRDYRKTAASLVLFRRLGEDALAGGMVTTLLSCEPGLYASYLRLGFRPLGSVHQGSSGGFRIPMVLMNHDLEHYRRVKSPMLAPLSAQAEATAGPASREALLWYRTLEARTGTIDPGVAFYADNAGADGTGEGGDGIEVHAPLTRGLSAAGRAAVLHNAIEIPCHAGDVVLAAGDGGRNMGFVLSGAVQAQIGGRTVSMVGEGELFGEIAVVMNTTRTATLVAVGDDTRVLMLSQTCLDRLDDPADRTQVWRNLAQVLATRVIRFHE
ncbi:MAG: cyclic nucleotide-binding domain-containing protein [Rubrivivax sp.]|nr:cyclic nucleotide-binding domain-containing protein [Rubrivivax sp.]